MFCLFIVVFMIYIYICFGELFMTGKNIQLPVSLSQSHSLSPQSLRFVHLCGHLSMCPSLCVYYLCTVIRIVRMYQLSCVGCRQPTMQLNHRFSHSSCNSLT